MLHNNFKVAIDNIFRNKFYSFINIGGLAIGLTISILITVYINHEISYDQFHKNAKKIFKLQGEFTIGGTKVQFPMFNLSTGDILKSSISSIKESTRIYKINKEVIIKRNDNEIFSEGKVLFVDSNFFSFFSFDLNNAVKSHLLNDPFSIVISRSKANQYFGNDNPVGQTLKLSINNKFYLFHITAVTDDVPSNSSIKFDFLASLITLSSIPSESGLLNSQRIESGSAETYLLLKSSTDSSIIQDIFNRNYAPKDENAHLKLSLISLLNIHFKSANVDSIGDKYFVIFPFIGILVLILSIVNYVSLTTARATVRAKEIGVRKVLGATKLDLIRQFFLESIFYTASAFLISLILCYFFAHIIFNNLNLQIDRNFILSIKLVAQLIFIFFVTTVLAGGYPALILSRFNPIDTLEEKNGKNSTGALIRKVLTVFQFSVSIGLLICGFIIRYQINFIKHSDTGINRKDLVMIPLSNFPATSYSSFKNDVKSIPGINNVATSQYAFYGGTDLLFTDSKIDQKKTGLSTLSVDPTFIPTLGLKWTISPDPTLDLTNGSTIVINEDALKALGYSKSNVIGQVIHNGKVALRVGGVLKNFDFDALQSKVTPLGLTFGKDTTQNWSNAGGCMFVKINGSLNQQKIIGIIKLIFNKYNPIGYFNYVYLDDTFNEHYASETRLANIFNVFAFLSLFLALIGLIGLAIFTIERRAKEVSIRKTLGAGVVSIFFLLCSDIIKLLILSALVTTPLVWGLMHNWLQGFYHRIELKWWMFTGGILFVTIVVLLSVSYNILAIAFKSPIDNLRRK